MHAHILDHETLVAVPKAKPRARLSESNFPRKILLIDENRDYCRRVRFAAQEFNSLVVYCNSLGSVTRLIEVDKFDLVIVSKEFEGFAGRILAEFLGLFFKDIPIIMLNCREDGFRDGDPEAPRGVIGAIPRHFPPVKMLLRVGEILNKVYHERPTLGFDPSEYTQFCYTSRWIGETHPVVKKVLATVGKVLLANASLVLRN